MFSASQHRHTPLPVFEVACLVLLGLPTFFLVHWYLATQTR